MPPVGGPLPASLNLTLADRLYVERSGLPQPLLNRLMRLSVWDKPRVIGCAENFPQHIALPRGCLEPVQTLLQEQGIDWLDLGHPVPQRMWERRLRGYRAMGYELTSTR